MDFITSRRNLLKEEEDLDPHAIDPSLLAEEVLAARRCFAADPLFTGLRNALEPVGRTAKVAKTFFVTHHGLCGVAFQEIRLGDEVVILFQGAGYGRELPFVLRRTENKTYRMISVAHVSDTWVELCKAARALEALEIIIC